MKNFQKLALGLMVGIMAIGFSAFTSVHHTTATTARYYNQRADHNPSTNAADFVFIDNDVELCTSSTTKQCSAEWSTANAPVVGQTPLDAGSPSIVSGSTTPGIYSN